MLFRSPVPEGQEERTPFTRIASFDEAPEAMVDPTTKVVFVND